MVDIKECRNGHRCPYLDGLDVFSLLKDWEYLKARVSDLEMKLNQSEKEKWDLKQEKEFLQYQLKQAQAKIFKPRVKPKFKEGQPKRGAPVGHRGGGRKRPKEITRYVDVYPKRCNKCRGEINPGKKYDEHIVEEITVIREVTCYRFYYGYCPRCGETIRLKSEDKESIMPYDRIGPGARAVGGYLRYLGLSYGKVEKIFKDVFGLEITPTTFRAFNTEQAQHGLKVYEEIKEKIRHSPCVNGDETGWRVDGENWWLWVFTNKDATFYQIDKGRGREVVHDVLGEKYQGILVSDFYSAYNELDALAKQRCVGHLLNEIKKIQEKNKFGLETNEGIFCQRLKEVLKQTIEVWKDYHKGVKTKEDLKREKGSAISEVIELLLLPSEHEDIRRIRKRIIKHQQELFVFLDHPFIEPTNNRAERQLRPNVLMRKVTFGHRTESGAKNHAIIMSIVQTGISQGYEPLEIFKALTINAVGNYLWKGNSLSDKQLPTENISHGVKSQTSQAELPRPP